MTILFEQNTVSLWPVALALLAVLLGFLWWRTRSVPRLVFSALFGLYLLMLVAKTFFPLPLMDGVGVWFREPGRWPLFVRSMNLVPFRIGHADPGLRHLIVRRMVENVLMTIPFGFGVSFVADIRRRDVWWLVPTVGVALEGMQFVLSLLAGGGYRTVDVNDVLLNALGVLIGYGLFRVFGWVHGWVVRRLDIEPRGIFGYIDDVVRGVASTPVAGHA